MVKDGFVTNSAGKPDAGLAEAALSAHGGKDRLASGYWIPKKDAEISR
jgi:hypothetical protein